MTEQLEEALALFEPVLVEVIRPPVVYTTVTYVRRRICNSQIRAPLYIQP